LRVRSGAPTYGFSAVASGGRGGNGGKGGDKTFAGPVPASGGPKAGASGWVGPGIVRFLA